MWVLPRLCRSRAKNSEEARAPAQNGDAHPGDDGGAGEDERVQGADGGCEEPAARRSQKCQQGETHRETFRARTSM